MKTSIITAILLACALSGCSLEADRAKARAYLENQEVRPFQPQLRGTVIKSSKIERTELWKVIYTETKTNRPRAIVAGREYAIGEPIAVCQLIFSMVANGAHIMSYVPCT